MFNIIRWLFTRPRARRKLSNAEVEKRNKARRLVHYAIKDGFIKVPRRCQRCGGRGPLEAHHTDYNRPLDVTFLCITCHGKTRRHRR